MYVVFGVGMLCFVVDCVFVVVVCFCLIKGGVGVFYEMVGL